MQKCQDFVNWYNLRKIHKDAKMQVCVEIVWDMEMKNHPQEIWLIAKMQVCIEIVRDMEMKNHPQEIWLIWWATVIKISLVLFFCFFFFFFFFGLFLLF